MREIKPNSLVVVNAGKYRGKIGIAQNPFFKNDYKSLIPVDIGRGGDGPVIVDYFGVYSLTEIDINGGISKDLLLRNINERSIV